MRSLIIYEVEHGDGDVSTTDALESLLASFDVVVRGTNGVTFKDSTVRVDVPKSMVLDLDIPSVEALHKNNASTPPEKKYVHIETAEGIVRFEV